MKAKWNFVSRFPAFWHLRDGRSPAAPCRYARCEPRYPTSIPQSPNHQLLRLQSSQRIRRYRGDDLSSLRVR